MKVRTDFVTNSSSSSFIIAVKDGLKESEAEAFVDKYFASSIAQVADDFGEDVEVDMPGIREELIDKLMDAGRDRYGMKLDGWTITAGEASFEDSGAGYVLHISGEYNSPKIKFKNVGC